jgi:hypothetical protein
VTFTPPRLPQAALTRASRASVTRMDLIFYVGYLRDPQGNKIALFSNDTGEPGREG